MTPASLRYLWSIGISSKSQGSSSFASSMMYLGGKMKRGGDDSERRSTQFRGDDLPQAAAAAAWCTPQWRAPSCIRKSMITPPPRTILLMSIGHAMGERSIGQWAKFCMLGRECSRSQCGTRAHFCTRSHWLRRQRPR